MYLRVVLTLLLLVSGVIAAGVWRQRAGVPPSSIAGELPPFGVWPHDKVGVDPLLDKRINVVINADRLDLALLQFRQQSGVNLAWKYDDLPVMSGEPIRLEFRDTTVEAALTELLALGLRPPPIGTRDGTVVIGSNAAITRFYDVRSILPSIQVPAPALPATHAGGGGGGLFVPSRPLTKEEGQATMLRSLVNTALRGTYATDAFDDDSVIYWNGVLIIRDRPEAHRKIIRLFETLRTADYAPK